MGRPISNITIAGGGATGWIVAAYLNQRLRGGAVPYAFHIDAGRLAEFLREVCVARKDSYRGTTLNDSEMVTKPARMRYWRDLLLRKRDIVGRIANHRRPVMALHG